jgi:hypothetical protein
MKELTMSEAAEDAETRQRKEAHFIKSRFKGHQALC